jgi:dipeptidyl aminopeptidase/acylaminoacyl peptidase
MTTIEAPPTTKPLTPELLIYGFTAAGDPQVSPDGTQVAYVVSKTHKETTKTSSQVWFAGIDGSDARQVTSAGERNGSPRWSPDGRSLAFVSDRVEKSGLFLLPMGGGEARELTRNPAGIGDPAWSSDGTRIAFTASVDPANPSGEKPKEGAAPKVRVTSRIDYKQDNRGYLDDVRSQVFVVDVATGGTRQLTTEAVDHNFPAWSPDGNWLAVGVPNRNGMCSQLELVPVGAGEPVRIGNVDGTAGTWTWTPDGRRLCSRVSRSRPQLPGRLLRGGCRHKGDPAHHHYTRRRPGRGFPTIMPASHPCCTGWPAAVPRFRAGASGIYALDAGPARSRRSKASSSCARSVGGCAAPLHRAGCGRDGSRGEVCVVDVAAGGGA